MFSDKTEDSTCPGGHTTVGGHITIVHTVAAQVQMLALVSKAWIAALNEYIDRQTDDRIPDFIADTVLDGLDLCHCDQYADPWDLALGEVADS